MEYVEKIVDKAVWPIVLAITGAVAKLFKEFKAIKGVNVSIARKDIIGIYENARDRGYTTDYEYEAMSQLLRNYYELGGNGVIHKVEKMYNEIPMRTNPLDDKLSV